MKKHTLKSRVYKSLFVFFSLRRHISAINRLSDKGMYFWDYGNAFLLEAGRAGTGNLSYTQFSLDLVINKFNSF